MLELIKFFLQKIDFLAIAEVLRKHKNRQIAAQLHVILVQAYEIIEIYRVLLDELKAALNSYQQLDDQERFFLNPGRIAHLLNRQASNLEVMEQLTSDLLEELRILDNRFVEVYRELVPGKMSILFEAQNLLAQGRLPLAAEPEYFPANADGECRTLWFTWQSPKKDGAKIETYPYSPNEQKKTIVDVNFQDGDAFFQELARYFRKEDPEKRLCEIEQLTEQYKEVLLKNFSVGDLLADIGKIHRHNNWAKRS